MAQPKQTIAMALEHFKRRIYAEIAATRMGNFRAQDARCLALIARVGQAVNEFEDRLKAGGMLPVRPVDLSGALEETTRADIFSRRSDVNNVSIISNKLLFLRPFCVR